MAYLPQEIHEQILKRLSVRDLIRFKSVCKSWQSLISDQGFIKAQLKHSYLSDQNNNEFRDRKLVLSTCPGFIKYNHSTINDMFIVLNDHNIIGSCDGLVCVSPPFNKIAVINPSTTEVKNVTKPRIRKIESRCSGFGYDRMTDDYKIFLGFKKSENCTSIKVFSLRTNMWKDFGEVKFVFISRVGVLCNGLLHWVVNDT